jgi:hypothetical protein
MINQECARWQMGVRDGQDRIAILAGEFSVGEDRAANLPRYC